MDTTVLLIFCFVYLGMILGEFPGLALDRTGIALLGAIACLATGRLGLEQAWRAVDVSTIALLLGLMVVSAQFRLGGFYTRLVRGIASANLAPGTLLALLVAVAGLLSALLANDVVCLAMAPVLVEGCTRRRLNPAPFLLGLACAANVGSAATLIGNPQNMLIGQQLSLSFSAYLVDAGVPSALGLVVVWWVIRFAYRGRWESDIPVPDLDLQPFDAWQTGKGAAVLLGLVALFLCTALPRDVAALAAAGLLFTSRRLASRRILALIDWPLLVLFASLFAVNHVLAASGALERMFGALRATGLDLGRTDALFGAAAVLSNLVSNVPAVMLLLPASTHPQAGPVLALSSTLAGNLIVVGSIANIIVIDQAARLGVRIGWREHARIGVPVTVLTLAIAAGWLVLIGA